MGFGDSTVYNIELKYCSWSIVACLCNDYVVLVVLLTMAWGGGSNVDSENKLGGIEGHFLHWTSFRGLCKISYLFTLIILIALTALAALTSTLGRAAAAMREAP